MTDQHRPTTVDEWKAEIQRRAARWAAEDAAAAAQRIADARAAQQRRAAEWPIERIRSLMTAETDVP